MSIPTKHLCAACDRRVAADHAPEWQCQNLDCGVWFHGDICPDCGEPNEAVAEQTAATA